MSDINSSNGCLSNFEETNHDIEQIKNIDSLLKCGICYEYFTTCVVTSCSHNFCSLCIRKYIQFKTECPVCFQQLYDSQLHANRIVDNLVNVFADLKDRIICHLRNLKTLKPNCIYVSPSKKSDVTPLKTTNVRSNTPTAGSSQLANFTAEPNKVIIPKIFLSPAKKTCHVENVAQKYVPCPVCSVEISERNINAHLDDCLNRDKDEKRKEQWQSPKRKHLPKLVYRLMSVGALRSKVKEHGLNSQGDFETLKSRLQRYTALYNAECDKTDPRPVQEIIRQLEREEKVLSSQKLPKSIFHVSHDDLSKEELNEQYLKENKTSFQKLVSHVKQRKKSSVAVAKKDCDDERDTKEHLSTYYCEPSTSKSSFNDSCNSGLDTKDWIEIEEHNVKIEPPVEIKEENVDEKPVIDIEKTNKVEDAEDDDDDVVSSRLQKHRRKSKRNLFQTTTYNNLDSDENDENLLLSGNIAESSDDIYSNHSDDTDFEDHSSSPVMKRGFARKRGKKETRGKNFRKRKK